jgi:hypothetical protein
LNARRHDAARVSNWDNDHDMGCRSIGPDGHIHGAIPRLAPRYGPY